jgi:HK97 family phage portal protein
LGIFSFFKDRFQNNRVTDEKMWNSALWQLAGHDSSGENVNEYTALNYSAVFNAISLISGTIAALPLNLMRRSGDTTAPETNHTLYPVLHSKANAYMASMAVRECMISHVLTWGNGYLEVVRDRMGQISELWPITPNRVTPKMKDDRLVYEIRIDGQILILERENILHIPGLGFDGFMGYSIVGMAAKSIGLGMAMETFGSNYFGQGTHPGVIASHPGKLSDVAHKNLRDSLVSTYSGLGKSHRLMLLEEGMKLEKVGVPPNDSQFLECVTPDTLFSMADGSLVPAKHIKEGDLVVGWENNSPVSASVKAVAEPKTKKLIKIKTARGRELTASEDHPVLSIEKLRTPGGRVHAKSPEKWTPMQDLKVGSYVRVSLGMCLGNTGLVDEMGFNDAYFLGAMVGDGYLRKGCCAFCTDNAGIAEKMACVCESLGGNLKSRKTQNNDFNYEIITRGVGVKGSKIRDLFNRSGLVGKHSHTKFVPEIVFNGGHNAWTGFLSGFFDTDGSIRSKSGKQVPALYWASTSIELLRGCQHMLAMLGVQSAIYKMCDGGEKVIMGKTCDTRESWGLYVMSNSHLKKIAKLLKLSHKEKKIRLEEYESLSDTRYREINFIYDRIVSIEDVGKGETIGIEIEGCHTHVTNGIVTHNSRQFQIPEIARWFNLPPHKLKDLTKSSFSNIESEQISYVTDSLLPWAVRIEQNLNMQLLTKQEIKSGLYFNHVFEGLLRGSSTDRAGFYSTMFNIGAMSINEIRAKENLNPVEGGDIHLVPLNMTSLENAGKPPEQVPEPLPEPERNDKSHIKILPSKIQGEAK